MLIASLWTILLLRTTGSASWAQSDRGPFYCTLFSPYTLEHSEILPILDQPLWFKAGPYEATLTPGATPPKFDLTVRKTGISELSSRRQFDPSTDQFISTAASFLCAADPASLLQPERLKELAKYFDPPELVDESQQEIEVDAPLAYVSVHPTSEFDEASEGREPTRAVLKLLRKRTDAEIILISHLKEPDSEYYFPVEEAGKIVFSESGSHRLHFARARVIVISGGYFDRCMCEAIRDVLVGIKNYSDTPDLVIPLEATYGLLFDSQSRPEAIINHVNEYIWGGTAQWAEPEGIFCHEQNLQIPISASLRNNEFSLELRVQTGTGLYRKERLLGTLGSGPKRARLIFVSVSELASRLTAAP